MAIDLSVQVVGRKLLEQAKAVAAANRAAQVERERLQRIKAQAIQRQQQSRRLLEPGDGGPVARRNPATTAPRISGFNISIGWYQLVPNLETGIWQYAVGSGNGQQWLSGSIDLSAGVVPDLGPLTIAGWDVFLADVAALQATYDTVTTTVFGASAARIDASRVAGFTIETLQRDYGKNTPILQNTASLAYCLPVGNTMVLLFALELSNQADCFVDRSTRIDGILRPELEVRYPFGEDLPYTARAFRAFVVGHTGCRQISVPAGLQSVLDAIFPAQTFTGSGAAYPGTGSGGAIFQTWAQRYFNPQGYVSYGTQSGLIAPTVGIETFSPAVYTWLNYANSIAPTVDFDYAATAAVLELYSALPQTVATDDPRTDGFSSAIAAAGNLKDFYADAGAEMSALRFALAGVSQIDAPSSGYDGPFTRSTALPFVPPRVAVPYSSEPLSMVMAWDWGNPAYCRQQLLALGFTAGDLVP